MTKIPFILNNNSITLVVNGLPEVILKSDKAYKRILKAIEQNKWDAVKKEYNFGIRNNSKENIL